MGGDRFGESLWVVAPFENADDATAGIFASRREDCLRQSMEIVGFQLQRADRIVAVGIEAGTLTRRIDEFLGSRGFGGGAGQAGGAPQADARPADTAKHAWVRSRRSRAAEGPGGQVAR